MTEPDKSFQQQLEADLAKLGQAERFHVDADQIIGRLRRRRAVRVTAGAAAAVLVFITAWGAWTFMGAQGGNRPQDLAVKPSPDRLGPQHPLPHPAIAKELAALPLSAEKAEILDGLKKVFNNRQTSTLRITKTTPEDLSFVVADGAGRPNEDVRRDLVSLFRNFDHVDVRVSLGRVSYSLVARAGGDPPHNQNRRSLQ